MVVNRSLYLRLLAVTSAAVFVVLAGLGVGCSSTDDVVGDATAQAVEAGLNDVLTGTVEPLAAFLGAVPTIVGAGVARTSFGGGVTCPDTGSVCSAGSVTCTPSGGGFTLTFDFDECVVATGDEPFTLDGVVVATPGATIALSLNSLFINNSAAMTGTGSVTVGTCSIVANVGTTDGTSVVGSIIQCDSDNYPTVARLRRRACRREPERQHRRELHHQPGGGSALVELRGAVTSAGTTFAGPFPS